MRVGLLGDIHGNADALSVVLAAARGERIERLYVTGDFVGYYYRPAEALAMLAEWDYLAVRGNHDVMLLDCLDDPELLEALTQKYGSGLHEAIRTLPGEAIELIRRLPVSGTIDCPGGRLILAHGAPWDTDLYIYPDAGREMWERLAGLNAAYIVLGHTHYQFSRRAGDTLVVNPGSVGQPRDRRLGAAWSILDTMTGAVEHRRESYDMTHLMDECYARDPEMPFLRTVLTRS